MNSLFFWNECKLIVNVALMLLDYSTHAINNATLNRNVRHNGLVHPMQYTLCIVV